MEINFSRLRENIKKENKLFDRIVEVNSEIQGLPDDSNSCFFAIENM
jgi:hypothetical protein